LDNGFNRNGSNKFDGNDVGEKIAFQFVSHSVFQIETPQSLDKLETAPLDEGEPFFLLTHPRWVGALTPLFKK
jgi:hypothetical protein